MVKPMMRTGECMGRKESEDVETVRRSVTLQKDVYVGVKRLSRQLGISPGAFITMTVTSKVNDIEFSLHRGKG